MVHNNKILTVSYGTFSCTLEGFEDSFDTMKAIAEYFRDLAADDRYFGAEPPQPDAEMLARIAEREIARQVEARRDGDGFVLRASEFQGAAPAVAAPPPVPPAAAQTPSVAPVAAAPAPAPAAPAPAPMAEAEMPEAEPVADTLAEMPADSIAAKLSRIRAVVSRNEAAEVADYSEDQHADAFVAAAADELSAALDADDDIESAEDAADEDLAAAFAALDEMIEAPEAAIADDREPAEVAEAPAEETEVEEAAAEEAKVEEAAADQTDPMPAADADSDAEDYDEIYDAAEDADKSDVLSVLSAVQQSAEPVAEAAEPETPRADDLDLSAFLISDDDTGDAAEDDELIDVLEEGEDGDAPRLLKIRKSELEAAIAAGEIEEIAETEDDAQSEDLSPEDEAELMAELARVEAEATAADDDADDDTDIDDDAEDTAEMEDAADDDDAADTEEDAQAAWLPGADEADEDLSRLMAAAEEKMGTPENSVNRETYSHLRAAVAVAEAERSAGGNVDEDGEAEAYREDLASVVRPRRPVSSGAARRPERPEAETRAAPLKLVAEQRIDLEEGARMSRGPVRPRRVAASETEAMADQSEGGFAEFAAEMGATELPELLEAAAAYLSFVEGRDQFSRPQLMNKVRQLDSHEFNREDGLRSFGQLLREGKIEKTGGGRFTASGDIGYRPDERAAG